jgi:competence protein ComEC
VVGRTVSRVEVGRTVPFSPEAGLPGACSKPVRLLLTGDVGDVRAGERLQLRVRWEARGQSTPARAEWAGRMRVFEAPERVGGGGARGRLLGLRGAIQEEIQRLWGDRAPMVEALVLARREHLDPDLREAFAHSGTAHLLAISGFHVGVVAGLFMGVLRLGGFTPRRAATGAAIGCWMYVLGIGAPHAAVRAALLLTILAAARLRGRPIVPVGALAAALLILLVVDPRNLASIGFQLSFAGTGGLVLLRKPLTEMADSLSRRVRGRPIPRGRLARGPAEGLLKNGSDGLVTGTAATLPTLPLLAWHFDRISLVGIPATLAVAPVVAASIPGVGAALLLAPLPGGLDRFLAGGVGLLLALTERAVRGCAELPGSSIWVSRPALFAAGGTGVPVIVALSRLLPGRVRPRVRWTAATGVGASAILLAPLLPGPDALELHMIDVGQGDAVALRLPSDRWIVVDAGPRQGAFDAGARRVVPYLRRNGARRVEALILTHPHLDHIGGAPAVMEHLDVRGVGDPSRPVPSRPWRETLVAGRRSGASWWPLEAGMSMRMDGVEIEVLHPDRETLQRTSIPDWNDLSLVLLVRFHEGAVLLTGDASEWIERKVLDDLPPLSVLKVGHHGSRTSSGATLLDRTGPAAAVVPVGDPNQYGHPHPEVIARYESRGIPTYRTDRDGNLRVRVHRDGRVEVRTSR